MEQNSRFHRPFLQKWGQLYEPLTRNNNSELIIMKKSQVNSITHPPDLENLRYASGSPLVLPYGLIINIQNMFIEYL